MGCCGSRPVEDDASHNQRPRNPPPQTRHSPQVITSRTAINGANDPHHPSLIPPSLHRTSSASHSGFSTSRAGSAQIGRQQSLSEHYNLPLTHLQPWTSRNKAWTRSQLQRERFEFFESRVTGRKEVWNGLKQVIECLREADIADAQAILDALSVTLPTGRLTDGAYDENGNLYKIPEAVISDPTEVVEDTPRDDIDTQTVTGNETIDAKLEAAEQENVSTATEKQQATLLEERARAAKGKTPVRDALKVRCRLSDRGSPDCDVTILLERKEKVGILAGRIMAEKDIPSDASLRFAYLGKMLDDKRTLEEQGWAEGHMVQALVVGDYGPLRP